MSDLARGIAEVEGRREKGGRRKGYGFFALRRMTQEDASLDVSF
jgi:hypothetical protein